MTTSEGVLYVLNETLYHINKLTKQKITICTDRHRQKSNHKGTLCVTDS